MISLRELQQHAFVGEAESLAKFGFNPREQVSSLRDFSQQMESHALHVIEDRPVSNVYSYFVDNEEIYLDKEKRAKLFVDPEERNGLSLIGTKEAIRKALFYPGQIVFLYSPPGQVAFKKGTKYDKVKPYPDGQLYLLVGKNDNQVDAMAISVSKEQEKKVLSTFLGKKMNYGGFNDEVEKIKYFLTRPVISNWNLDDFLIYLERISYLEDFSVYKNVHNEKFVLSDILYDLRRGWMKEIRPKIKIDYQQSFEMIQKGNVGEAYLNQLQNYFSIYSRNGKMPLGGGCGGNDINENDLDPLASMKQTNPLSTNYRLSTPSIQDILKKNNDKDSDEYGLLKFQCPVCNGEHTRPRHILLEICPIKGKEIPKC